MRTKDLFKFAANGMKRRTARTFLTVLGVIIGTVCIVLMFAIGLSNYQQFEQNVLNSRSLTEITINHYSGTDSIGVGITDSTVDTIRSLGHVKAVSPVLQFPVTITAGKYTATLMLMGVEPEILDLDFQQGELFSGSSGLPQIVLGSHALSNFIDPKNPPNYNDYEEMENYKPDIDLLDTEMEMRIGYESEDAEIPKSQIYRAKVSGIIEPSYNEQSYNAYIDFAVAKKILMDNRELADYLGQKPSSYDTVKIIVDDMENIETVLAEVRKLGYETYSPTESIMQMQEEQARQQGQLLAIGFISLLVSAIGIANTMYANILERKRDIGVMKVLGMPIAKIRGLFVVESSMIGLLGGLIGIGVSYIVVLAINTGTSETSFLGMYFEQGMKIAIPPWLSLVALLIAVGVGVVSGIYPANKATKLSPLEAMRN